MIIALFTMLFLGGDSHVIFAYLNVYEDRAEMVITDEARLSNAFNILNKFEDSSEELSKSVSEMAEQFGEVVGDRYSTDTDIDAVWNSYYEDVEAYHSLVIDSRFELKQYVNQDEWLAIFGSAVTAE